MGDVVNLNTHRKRAERLQKAEQAKTSRARFGRTKAERARDEQQADRASKTLEQHRIGPDDT